MSELLDQQTETRLLSDYRAGNANALAPLALLAAIQLQLAVAAEADAHRDDQWEDAGQQVICDLLAKPARVLRLFRPDRGRLVNYLLGRVRGRLKDLHRTDQRCHEREQAAWTQKMAPGSSHQIDWEQKVAPIWPSLTPEKQALVRRLLNDLDGRRCGVCSENSV